MFYKRLYVVFGLLLTVLFVFLQLISTYNSAVFLSRKNIKNRIVLLPQGWGFFTKNPKDSRVVCYKEGKSIVVPHFSVYNFFGINRHPSRVCYEIGLLTKKLPDSLWHKGYVKDSTCFFDYHIVNSRLKYPAVDKKITVINEERLPWAWKGLKTETLMPFYFINIQIEAHNEKYK